MTRIACGAPFLRTLEGVASFLLLCGLDLRTGRVTLAYFHPRHEVGFWTNPPEW